VRVNVVAVSYDINWATALRCIFANYSEIERTGFVKNEEESNLPTLSAKFLPNYGLAAGCLQNRASS